MKTPPPSLPQQHTLLRYWPVPACLLLAALLFWLEPAREISALAVVLTYLSLCLLKLRPATTDDTTASLLIAYASQGGQARELAERSAMQLRDAGLGVRVRPLNNLSLSTLQQCSRALFIVSTYGEGEAPDNGARFAGDLLASSANLAHLDYALLALGDRQYQHFCGFGRRLDQRLRTLQARPLFDCLEVDHGDAGTLRHWQQQLGHIAGRSDFVDWQPVPYQRWRLIRRECLNPGSSGFPLFHLAMRSLEADAHWQAGDIAEVGPRHSSEVVHALLQRLGHAPGSLLENGQSLAAALAERHLPDDPASLQGLDAKTLLSGLPLLPHREYSIASVPEDGQLDLLVRQTQHADGRLGLGSGWLCRHAQVGGEIALRIRRNPDFHGPDAGTPMILIGNGSGLAGLRAHLRERAAAPGSRNWLLFGERTAEHDFLFREELQGWLQSGHLQRLDLAFSRDQAEKIYVQHLLRDAADELRRWIDAGAALYLCGSLEGMGRDLQQILTGLLGEAQLQQLTEQGRYRRDLY